MFSPALVAMMHQALSSDTPVEATQPQEYKENYPIKENMRHMLKVFPGEIPRIPVVGFSRLVFVESQWFKQIETDRFDGDPTRFFWGRIPVTELMNFYGEMHAHPPEVEFFDVGTPLRQLGSGSTFDTNCRNFLAQTGQAVTVSVAIVDRGKTRIGQTPDDYTGKLRHAVTQDVILDDHAEKVLSVLLDRLNHHGILPEVQVSCSLVKEPAHAIGRACFRHANAVEMLDSLKALRTLIAHDNLPIAINLSMGTHVGPHNGDSPLEEYIARIGNLNANRFLHAAAGNDGLSGVAAVKEVKSGEREFFRATVAQGSTDLLIEFWWHDPNRTNVKVEVTIQDSSGQRTLSNLWIDPTTVGRTLKIAPQGFGQAVAKSLFHAQCRNQMSCIAFALSPASGQSLPALNLLFSVDSPDAISMHSWIVVCDAAQGMFVEGDSSATITVPASAPDAISVAGVDDQGQPWIQSSRGPAVVYQAPPPKPHFAPAMAHRADLGSLGMYGTSFASPRACADTANVIRDPNRLAHCGTILGLLTESYPLQPGAPWDARKGYIAVSQ